MSGEHDAASVVGQMAGLTTGESKPERVTPEMLAQRFCGQAAEAGMGSAHNWREQDGHRVARGFCGYLGGRGDGMLTGFDEGYSFMGYLEERGWRALASKGDWPYVIYMAWPGLDDGKPAIAGYCEADLTVWEFESLADAQAFARTLRDAP